jgi:hypothetical protein
MRRFTHHILSWGSGIFGQEPWVIGCVEGSLWGPGTPPYLMEAQVFLSL